MKNIIMKQTMTFMRSIVLLSLALFVITGALPVESAFAETLWSAQKGSVSQDLGKAVAFYNASSVYMAGYTYNAIDGYVSLGTGADLVLLKYNPATGARQWTVQKGLSGYDVFATGVAVDSSENVYVTGYTTGGLDGNANAGGTDLFLMKYNSSGSRLWTRQLGSTSNDYANSVTVDASGNIYVTGETYGGLDGNTNAGLTDLFVVKYDSAGTKQWTRQLGTSTYDYGKSVSVDTSGNVYVAGHSAGAFAATNAGNYDIILVKYNSAGTLIWSRQLGSSNYDYAGGLAVDASGNAYIAGYTAGGLDGNTSAGSYDIFLMKYDSAGARQWTRQTGTSYSDLAYGVAVDNTGSIFVSGSSGGSLDGNTSAGLGYADIVLVKYNSAGVKMWTQQYGSSSYDVAYGVDVEPSTGDAYVTGYTDGNLVATNAGSYDIFFTKFNGATPLTNNVPVYDAISATATQAGWDYYYVDVPYGAENLVFNLANQTSDADLYVKYGSKPNLTNYDCRPYIGGTTSEQCSFSVPSSGRWWIAVNNYSIGVLSYSIESEWVSVAPTGSISVNSGATYTTSPYVTLNLTCTDNVGCAYMQFTNDYVTWSPVETYNTSYSWTLDSGDGTKWAYAYFRDSAGNWSYGYADSIILDTTPPTGTVSINSGASITNSSTVTLNLSCTDANGCSQMQFTNDFVTWSPVYAYSTSASWTLASGDGAKNVYVYFKDNAGNWSYSYADSIIVDTLSPTGSVSINSGASITTSSSVTLNLSCTDANGCSQMQFSNDNATFSSPEAYATGKSWTMASGDGTKTVYARFKDVSGNWSSTYGDTIIFDTTAPSATVSINSGEAYSTSAFVSLFLSCSDTNLCTYMQFSSDNVNWSPAESYATGKNWSFATGDGTKAVYAKFMDTAGNWSSATSDTIVLDTTTPTGSVGINSGSAATGSVSVTLNLSCSDGNGCSQMQFSNDNITYSSAAAYATSASWTLVEGDGTKTVYARFKDPAGNWSSATSDTIILDTAAPAGSVSINSGASVTGAASVTLNLSCNDGNGCSQMQFSSDNITYSSATAYATSASWTLESGDGTKTVYARFMDASGNWSFASSDTIVLDTIAPAGLITINFGDAYASMTAGILLVSCNDDNGCAQMQFSNDNVTYSSAEAYLGSKNWTLSSGDGTKTVYAKFMDTAGNWSSALSDTIVLDTTEPSGSINVNSGADYSTSTSVTLNLSCSDTSGCSQMQFSNDNITYSSAAAYAMSASWTLTTGDGSKTVYVRFSDSTGNWSSAVNDSIVLDTTPPSGSVYVNSDASATSATSATLNLSCTDANGCPLMQFSNDNVTFSSAVPYLTFMPWTLSAGDGTKTVYARFMDASGNWSPPFNDTIVLDATSPDGTVSINSGASYTTSTSATLSLSCNDGNGCSEMQFSSDNVNWTTVEAYATSKAWTLSTGDGTKTVYAKFKDSVGNWSASTSASIVYDSALPNGSISINSDAVMTNSVSASLTLSCTDANGCAQMQFSNDNSAWSSPEAYSTGKAWTMTAGDGSKTVYVKFEDNSGNWSSVANDTIVLDTALPTGTISINSAATYTTSASVNLNLSCSDANGCSQMQFSNDNITYSSAVAYDSFSTWTLTAVNGTKTVYVKFMDTAGNWSSVASDTIMLDTVAPSGSVNINSGATLTSSTSVSLAVSCTDATSGCGTNAEMQFSNDNSTWSSPEAYSTGKPWTLSLGDGTKTVYAKLKDSAGNWSSAVSHSIVMDSTMPSGSISINSGAGSTNVTSVSLTLACTDTNVCTEMQFSNDNVNWSLAEAYATSKAWSLTTGDGTKTVYVKFKDGAGNWSLSFDSSITLSTVASAGLISINSDANFTTSASVTLTLICTDGNGCSQMQFSDDNITWSTPEAFATSKAWTLVGGSGINAVYVMFKNTLGNWSAAVSDTIVLDTTAPSGTVSVNSDAASTNSSSVSLSLSCTDANGCTQMQFSNDNSTWSSPESYSTGKSWTLAAGDGTKTVYAKFKDSAGNWSSAFNDAIVLDTTLPTGTVSVNSGATSAYSTSVSLTLSCTDSNGCTQMQFSNDNVTYSSEAAYASSASWTLTSGDGTKTVYVKFKDSTGNWSSVFNDSIQLDMTLPTGSVVINADVARTTSASVTLALSCFDANSCAEMQFSNDDTNWSAPEAYATSKTWTLGTGDGTKTVYVKFKDATGNWSASLNDAIVLDTVLPTGGVSVNGNASFANSASATLTLSCTDANGCAEMKFSNDDSTWSTPEAYGASKPWTLSSGDGTKTVYAQFMDSSGNWSSTVNDTITLDTTAPAGTITINSGSAGTSNVNVSLTLSCTDANACAEMKFSTDNSSWSAPEAFGASKEWTLAAGDGTKTVYVVFKDSAGNWSSSVSNSVILDTIAPTGSVNINSDASSSNSPNVTLSLSCTDTNGCSQMQFSNDNVTWSSSAAFSPSASWTLSSGDGAKNVYAKFKDTAGNWSSSFSNTILLDTTAPAGTVGINSGASISNSTGVALSLSCTDANACSEMKFSNDNASWSSPEAYATSKAWTLTAGDGAKAVYAQFKDAVGNWSLVVNASVLLDTANPTGLVVIDSDALRTNSTSVALTLSCTDANTCAEMQFSSDDATWSTPETYATSKAWTLASGDGAKTVYARFKDSTGNWSPVYSDAIILDMTLPTGSVDINSGTAIANSTSASLTLSCSDSSACAEMQFSNDGTSWTTAEAYTTSKAWTMPSGDGNKTVYAKFKDGAGNWSMTVSNSTSLDTIAPAGSISLNSDALYTASTSATLTLSCLDPSACAEMQFSNDNATWSTGEAYATSKSWTLSTGGGNKTVYAKFKDGAGNWSSAVSDTIMLDSTAPSGSVAINSGNSSTSSTSVTLTLTCTDANSCVEMKFSNDGTTYSSAIANAPTASWAITSGDGAKTVYAMFKDFAGNWSSAVNDNIVLDTSAPTGSLSINDGVSVVNTNSVTLSLTCSDSGGCSEMQFSNDGIDFSTPLAFANTSAWTLLDGDGTKTVYAKFKDSLGNWSVTFSNSVILDTELPTGTVSVNLGAVYTNVTAVTLTLTCLDTNDCSQMRFSNDGATYSAPITNASEALWTLSPGDGTKTVYVEFKDSAGNWSIASTDSITLDSTAPIGLVSINSGAVSTTNTQVSLSMVCSDPNGCVEMTFSNDNSNWSTPEAYVSSKTWTLSSGDGAKTAYVKFKDAAGNWTASLNDTITLDSTFPAGTVNIEAGALITNAAYANLTLSCTDESGCSEMQFSNDDISWSMPISYSTSAGWTLSSVDGVKTVYAKFKDTVGNWSTAVNDTIILDSTPPVGTVDINSGAALSNSTSAILALTCTDASGCAEMQFSNDNASWSTPEAFDITKAWALPTGDGAKTVYAKFKDAVGLWSASVSATITLDTAVPTGTININSDAALTNSTSATLTLTCTDANGCAEMQFSSDNSSWSTPEAYATSKAWTLLSGDGAKTVYAMFKDSAGNWSVAVNHSIIFDGTAPAGAVSINTDELYTVSSTVTLTLTCADANGCAEMQFSNDGVTYSSPISSAAAAPWTLSIVDGAKTVYAKFKDSAGNWSPPVNDAITIDTIPPVTTASPAGGTFTTAKVVTLACTDGGSGCGDIYYTLDGSTPTVSSNVYTAPIDIANTTTLKFFAKDSAGNKENTNTDVFTLNLPPDAPTGLTLYNMKTAGPTIGWTAVSGATGYKVYRSSDNSTWGTAMANASGTSYIDTNAPKSNTSYYWTVTAFNASGESAKPAGVSGRTALINGWNMVSAPFNTTGATASATYGSWAIWTWGWVTNGNLNPDRNGYWYQNPTIEPGFGQLLWAYNDSTVLSASGAVNVLPFDVVLKPGWNIISNPTGADLTDIGSAWLVDGSALSSAISANMLGGDLYWWDAITFDSLNIALDNPVVEPWKSYWILNIDSVDHTLTIK